MFVNIQAPLLGTNTNSQQRCWTDKERVVRGRPSRRLDGYQDRQTDAEFLLKTFPLANSRNK